MTLDQATEANRRLFVETRVCGGCRRYELAVLPCSKHHEIAERLNAAWPKNAPN